MNASTQAFLETDTGDPAVECGPGSPGQVDFRGHGSRRPEFREVTVRVARNFARSRFASSGISRGDGSRRPEFREVTVRVARNSEVTVRVVASPLFFFPRRCAARVHTVPRFTHFTYSHLAGLRPRIRASSRGISRKCMDGMAQN